MRTANVSSSLVWNLIRNYNSHQVRRHNGFVSTTFSKERGNLTNYNSPKFSGICNPQTVQIQRSGKAFSISVRNRRQLNKPNKAIVRIPLSKGKRKRVAKVNTANSMRNLARPSLKTAAVRRWERLYTNNRKQSRRRALMEKTKKKTTETKNVNDVN